MKSKIEEEKSWYARGKRKGWDKKFEFKRLIAKRGQTKEEWLQYGFEHSYNNRNPGIFQTSLKKEERSWYGKGKREGWVKDFPFIRKIRTIQDLETSLRQDKRLANLAAFANDSHASEVAKILTKLFPNRFKNEKKLTKLLIDSNVSKVVAPFKTRGSGIIPLLELLYEGNSFPAEVKSDLDNLVYEIAVNEFQPEFNADPEALMNKLEKLTQHENKYIATLMDKVKDYYRSIIDFKIPGFEV